MTTGQIWLCDILRPLLKHLPPPPVEAHPHATPLSGLLPVRCISPSPISKGNPTEYHLQHSKIIAILKIDQFDFFNRIWETFW